jgi:hypothetical protein
MKNFSSFSAPLTKLTQKNVKFKWFEACEKNFLKLKQRLTTTPILAVASGSDGYIVYCDASKVGLRCVLMQHDNSLCFMAVEET